MGFPIMHIHPSLLAETVPVYDYMLEGIECYTYIHDGIMEIYFFCFFSFYLMEFKTKD